MTYMINLELFIYDLIFKIETSTESLLIAWYNLGAKILQNQLSRAMMPALDLGSWCKYTHLLT